jgi:hypothetical protein
MALNVGDVLRVVAVLSWLDGDILQNVYNTEILSGTGPFDDDDVIDDMVDWLDVMYDNFVAQMSDEINGSECRVYVWDPVGADWDEVGINAFDFNPTNVGEQTARGVALLINAKSSDPDVSGKKYLGAFTEAAVSDGIFLSGEVTRGALFAADWFGDFVGAATGATFDPGIWSPTEETFFPMGTTAIIPSIPAYQRRRKNGVGI